MITLRLRNKTSHTYRPGNFLPSSRKLTPYQQAIVDAAKQAGGIFIVFNKHIVEVNRDRK